MNFDLFLEKVMQFGFEYFHMYYGLYRGTVTDNADPEDRGRVKLTAPGAALAQAPDIWIAPASFLGAGRNRGWFWPPEVGDAVWVAFSQGQTRYPLCYLPGFYGQVSNQSEVPTELRPDGNHAPRKRGVVTRRGHRFIFNETPDGDAIELVWHKPASDTDRTTTPSREGGETSSLTFDPQGGIALVDKNQNKITLDAENAKVVIEDQHGNKFTMSSEGVVLDCGPRNFEVKASAIKLSGQTVDIGAGASFAAMLGESWVQWAQAHTHGTGVGPTTPPAPPPTPALNSQSVKVKP
jgi:hypothetical protein